MQSHMKRWVQFFKLSNELTKEKQHSRQLADALRPFAELLFQPDEASGLIDLRVDSADIRKAAEALAAYDEEQQS